MNHVRYKQGMQAKLHKGVQEKMSVQEKMTQKRQSITAFHHYSNRGLSCDHCKLIDSGDVAMYQVTCPKCGEIPPGRRHLYPNIASSDVGAIIKCMKLAEIEIGFMIQ